MRTLKLDGLLPTALLLVIGLCPLVEIANNIAPSLLSVTQRAHLPEVLAAGIVVVAIVLTLGRGWPTAGRGTWPGGLGLLLLALLLWSVFCGLRSPYPDFALAEWLRVILGLGVYSLAAYGLRAGQPRRVIGGLIVLGAGMAASGLLQFGAAREEGGGRAFDHMLGLFGDNENLGSFLMLLLPLTAGQALDRENNQALRLGAQAAGLIMLVTLAITCTRAAWIGGLVGFAVMGLLTIRYVPSHQGGGRRRLLVASFAAGIVIVTLGIGGAGGMVTGRALSITHSTSLFSFTDRVLKSEAACRMAAARPWTGWGLGAWPVVQRRWTGEGDTPAQVLARRDVWSRGEDQQSLAHDFYAQWAAETGLPGLGLYVAALAAFFLSALRRLPRLHADRQRGLLISCLAAVAGGCVDSLASPAYNFPGVSVLFWLCLGLGVAACREERAVPRERPRA